MRTIRKRIAGWALTVMQIPSSASGVSGTFAASGTYTTVWSES